MTRVWLRRARRKEWRTSQDSVQGTLPKQLFSLKTGPNPLWFTDLKLLEVGVHVLFVVASWGSSTDVSTNQCWIIRQQGSASHYLPWVLIENIQRWGQALPHGEPVMSCWTEDRASAGCCRVWWELNPGIVEEVPCCALLRTKEELLRKTSPPFPLSFPTSSSMEWELMEKCSPPSHHWTQASVGFVGTTENMPKSPPRLDLSFLFWFKTSHSSNFSFQMWPFRS